MKFKREFKPFSTTQKLFSLTSALDEFNQKKCCADSHEQFNHPHPLWKNEEFFIKLPFKENEDINSTKAIHSSMNPEEFELARKQHEQLLALGLTKLTKSNWACLAFYVNKMSEQIRGKKNWQSTISS